MRVHTKKDREGLLLLRSLTFVGLMSIVRKGFMLLSRDVIHRVCRWLGSLGLRDFRLEVNRLVDLRLRAHRLVALRLDVISLVLLRLVVLLGSLWRMEIVLRDVNLRRP